MVTASRVEFRLEMRPTSSDSSVEVLYGLRGEGVVRERENRLGMRGTGRPKSDRKGGKGKNEASRVERATKYDFGFGRLVSPFD